jgi:hypothetical protein
LSRQFGYPFLTIPRNQLSLKEVTDALSSLDKKIEETKIFCTEVEELLIRNDNSIQDIILSFVNNINSQTSTSEQEIPLQESSLPLQENLTPAPSLTFSDTSFFTSETEDNLQTVPTAKKDNVLINSSTNKINQPSSSMNKKLCSLPLQENSTSSSSLNSPNPSSTQKSENSLPPEAPSKPKYSFLNKIRGLFSSAYTSVKQVFSSFLSIFYPSYNSSANKGISSPVKKKIYK